MSKSTIGAYRTPAVNGFSTVLRCYQDKDKFLFVGALTGTHTIHTRDLSRVRAHWQGYVSNVMKRTVRPAPLRFLATD